MMTRLIFFLTNAILLSSIHAMKVFGQVGNVARQQIIVDIKSIPYGAAQQEYTISYEVFKKQSLNATLDLPSSINEINEKMKRSGIQTKMKVSGNGVYLPHSIIIVKKDENLYDISTIELTLNDGTFFNISGNYWTYNDIVLLPVGSIITFKNKVVAFFGVGFRDGQIKIAEEGIIVMPKTEVNNLDAYIEQQRKEIDIKNNRIRLSENEIEKVVKETYNRMKQDVNISHILVSCKKFSLPADTLISYNKMMEIKKQLELGYNFEQLAVEKSDDKSVKENHGRLGYLTAPLPNGFYPLEKAVYNSSVGSIIGPIRTSVGYHIVRINSFRPARGEVEVAHILIRRSSPNAKMKIDSIYNLLQSGSPWEEICKKYSEEKVSSVKGGYLGFIKANQFQKPFEDAAFGIATDGSYSIPIETSIGWHIVKRISIKPIGLFEENKNSIIQRIYNDDRCFEPY